MKKSIRQAFLAVLWFCLFLPRISVAQVATSCVTYEPYVPHPSEIVITASGDRTKPTTGKIQDSPYGTRWFAESEPDFAKLGPWDTTVLIGDRNGSFLRFTAKNHASGGILVQWINEKLLFIRVWSGRIVSDDLILDVTTHRIIYSEQATYDPTAQRCGQH